MGSEAKLRECIRNPFIISFAMNYVEDADKNRRLENDGLMFVPLIAVIQLSRTAAGLGAIPARWNNNAC